LPLTGGLFGLSLGAAPVDWLCGSLEGRYAVQATGDHLQQGLGSWYQLHLGVCHRQCSLQLGELSLQLGELSLLLGELSLYLRELSL